MTEGPHLKKDTAPTKAKVSIVDLTSTQGTFQEGLQKVIIILWHTSVDNATKTMNLWEANSSSYTLSRAVRTTPGQSQRIPMAMIHRCHSRSVKGVIDPANLRDQRARSGAWLRLWTLPAILNRIIITLNASKCGMDYDPALYITAN